MLSPTTLADWEVFKVVTLGLEGVARIRGKMKTKEHSQKGKNEVETVTRASTAPSTVVVIVAGI